MSCVCMTCVCMTCVCMSCVCMNLCLHDLCLHDLCLHDLCLHDLCLHDLCLHDLCLHELCLPMTCFRPLSSVWPMSCFGPCCLAPEGPPAVSFTHQSVGGGLACLLIFPFCPLRLPVVLRPGTCPLLRTIWSEILFALFSLPYSLCLILFALFSLPSSFGFILLALFALLAFGTMRSLSLACLGPQLALDLAPWNR
jgi:hypothetical protein